MSREKKKVSFCAVQRQGEGEEGTIGRERKEIND